MSDLIKKTILAGMGVLVLSREKAEEVAKDLVKRGELAKKEEENFIKDLVKKGSEGKKEVENRIEEITKKTLVKLNIPSRKEFEELEQKIYKVIKKSS